MYDAKEIQEILDTSKLKFDLLQSKMELLSLLQLVHKPLKGVIEIGTHHGGTFYLWCKLFEGIKISIDPVKCPHNMLKWSEHVHIINKKSDLAVEDVRKILQGKKVDFLFIDGDHSYESVKHDFENYKPFVGPTGIIVLHDINNPDYQEVRRFWGELVGHKTQFVEQCKWRTGIGVINNNPHIKVL
jgi:cephalosporin hydroxylase